MWLGLFLSTLLCVSIIHPYPVSQEWWQRQRDDCARLMACDCIGDQNFAILCPASVNASIVVRIEQQTSGKRVNIECRSNDPAAFDQLPEWHIGNTDTVEFERCPIVASRPVLKLFKRLGIRNVRTLVISTPTPTPTLTSIESTTPIDQFSGYAFDGLHSIRTVNVQANGQNIPAATLTSLPNMDHFQLSFATFDRNPLLGNHRNLKRLQLLANQIPSLRKDLFHGTTSVTHLDLSTNVIGSIDGNALEYLSNLTELRLYGNQLNTLPAQLLTTNKALTNVALINNRWKMDGVPAGLLKNLPALTNVIINGCKCQRLPADLFANSTSIQTLSLAHNGLVDLPNTLFDTQVGLIDLDLSFNALATIDEALFVDTEKLKVLRLSHNRLREITSGLFSVLWELEELYLDHNSIHSIHELSFENTNIRVLDMSSNHLKYSNADSTPFVHLSQLTKLNLRNNSFNAFLTIWNTNCFQLEQLDLSYNSISTLNLGIIFDYWKNPVTVDLSHNQISTIVTTSEIDSQPNSTWILNNNPLRCDCLIQPFVESIRNPNEKVHLVVDNLMCAAPERFANQSPLTIDLSQVTCPLDSPTSVHKLCPAGCDCYVRAIDRTAIFNCSDGNLTAVPPLPDKEQLVGIRTYHLHIENNRITKLPQHNTTGYKDVNYLYARNNSIESVDAEELPDNMFLLDLTANKMFWLEFDVLSHLSRMETLQNISLHGNPWMCDCAATELQQFLRANVQRIHGVDNIACWNAQDTRLLDASYLCFWNDLAVALVAIVITVIVVVLIGLVLFHTYKLEVLIWLDAHRERFCPWFLMKTDPYDEKEFDAFIAHTSKDTEFVHENLMKELESGNTPLKLRSLDRDMLGGELMHDKVTEFVEKSRKTIVVLTPNLVNSITNRDYAENVQTTDRPLGATPVNGVSGKSVTVKDTIVKDANVKGATVKDGDSDVNLKKAIAKDATDSWVLLAFLFAHQRGLQDRRSRVIIIIAGNIGPINDLASELKAYLDSHMYLRWNENGFFKKLRYAINHPNYPQPVRRDYV